MKAEQQKGVKKEDSVKSKNTELTRKDWGYIFSFITAVSVTITAAIALSEFWESGKGQILWSADENDRCVDHLSPVRSDSAYVEFGLRNVGKKVVAIRASVFSDYLEFEENNRSFNIVPGDNYAELHFTGRLKQLHDPYPAYINYSVKYECLDKDCKINEWVLFECKYARNESHESYYGVKPYYELQ